MKVFTPEISWHERDPIYTCAFNPVKSRKFATAGVTGEVRLWQLESKESEKNVEVKFVANLKRHVKSVNVVRWNSDGSLLASAGDEAVVYIWNENEVKNQKTLDAEEYENIENWYASKIFRGHLEDILDISWSKDSTILISGSIDNSVIVWNVLSSSKLAILKEPKGFVQGVVYDPLGSTFAILSTDRCLRIFSTTSNKCIHNVNKIQMNKEANESEKPAPNIRIFHDDTMKSFFRRMCYSPDGNLLFTPSGCLEIDEKIIHTSYIFARNCYNRPCIYIPHDRPSVAIAVCPIKFELIKKNEEEKDLFTLPYRYVFAIATEDSIFFYDTQSTIPFSYVTGIHYSNLSDISWAPDGRLLIATSIDGFSTFVVFNQNELGHIYESCTPLSSSQTLSSSQNQNLIKVN